MKEIEERDQGDKKSKMANRKIEIQRNKKEENNVTREIGKKVQKR